MSTTIEQLRALVSDWQANGNSRPLGDPTANTWQECAAQLLIILDAEQDETPDRAKVITLCGSTRFKSEFETWNSRLTSMGNVVLSVGMFVHDYLPVHQKHIDKPMLDRLHRQKIDMADEVFVLDVGGYIGESTSAEIEYARSLGKPVRFLSVEDAVCVTCGRDNGNGTHSALERTGHLSHSFEAKVYPHADPGRTGAQGCMTPRSGWSGWPTRARRRSARRLAMTSDDVILTDAEVKLYEDIEYTLDTQGLAWRVNRSVAEHTQALRDEVAALRHSERAARQAAAELRISQRQERQRAEAAEAEVRRLREGIEALDERLTLASITRGDLWHIVTDLRALLGGEAP